MKRIVLLALTIIPVAVLAAPAPPLQFKSGVNYVAGGRPTGIVAADFNGDGVLDFAVANSENSSVTILIGNADGTFQAAEVYATGPEPLTIAAGDLNGDGNLDLAITSNSMPFVNILLGNGDGTFRSSIQWPTGSPSYSLVLGDFNGDGKPDIAISNVGDVTNGSNSNGMTVLIGNGDGTFQNPVNYAMDSHQHYGIAAVDFNGDGKLDIAVSDEGSNGVSIFLGNGDGTFQLPVSYGAGSLPVDVVAADFNHDGKLDLAITTSGAQGGSAVAILLGNGDGTFMTATIYSVGYQPGLLVAGDFNNDGNLDLAIADATENDVAILLGNGDGSFQDPLFFLECCGQPNPIGIVAGDFNRDGKLDFAVSNYFSQTVSVFLNDAAINQATPIALDVTVPSGPLAMGGHVKSSPAGIDCPGNTCNANFPAGSTVQLTATPSTGFIFAGWSGSLCSGNGTCSVILSAATSVTANFVNSPVIPQTGFWWNPNESGRGFVIEQRGGSLFMAAFLYAPSGEATWYGIGPGPVTGSAYTGALTNYCCGQTLNGAYRPPSVLGSAGSISISFSSATQGTLTWPEGTIPIQKFDFGPSGSEATQPVGTPQPGWWYTPTESGRGYTVEIQGNVMYFAAYMYDTLGNPLWYVSTGPMTNTLLYQGRLEQFGDGQTLTGTYIAPPVVNPNVGAITLQFTSTTSATLTLPDGEQVQIARFRF
jgi:hypothetical protein